MRYYLFCSTIGFFLLGVLWEKKNWANFFIKIVLMGLALTGLLFSLVLLGYVIVPGLTSVVP